MSLQLEEKTLELDGVRYPLRCNMAVLERLQDGPGRGEIGNLMQLPTYQVIFDILKAMIDDACEDNPELPEVSMRTLKKRFSPAQLGDLGIFRLFVNALSVSTSVSGSDTGTNENKPSPEGN